MVAVRRIITELRPSVLDQLGLVDAIEWQVQEFAARSGLEVDLDVHAACEPPTTAVATAVFRMLQEALTNVAKHAQATLVRVTLQIEPDALSLDITDDGRGITGGELRGTHSLGLLGLRERAIALGGKVTISRNVPVGTTVALRLPFRACGDVAGPAR
jgi:signal transduction histidine kinase